MLIKAVEWFGGFNRRRKTLMPYNGVVVNNEDPKKLGRLKVRTELLEGIPDEDLPWVSKKPNTFLGGSTKSGSVSIPEKGSIVCVEYPTEDVNFGFYESYWLTMKTRVSAFDEDYPNSYGFIDSIGNLFKINKIKKTVEFKHPSGTMIFIDKDGNVKVESVKNIDIIAKETMNLKAKTMNLQAETMSVNASTGNINYGSGDSVISGISHVSHVHPEDDRGDTGAPK